MGRAWSVLVRPIRNWNIDNRVQKVIAKQADKPASAPRYPSISKKVDDFLQEYPEYLEAQKKKDGGLVERLKTVRVESFGPPPEVTAQSRRSLPEDRSKAEQPEFGIREPNIIPEGKTTIRQAFDFLSQHQANPQGYTATHIAREYKLNSAQVQQVLKYYQTFHFHLPKEFLDKHPKAVGLMKGQLPTSGQAGQLPTGTASRPIADDKS